MFAASQTFVLTSTRSRPACIHTFFTLQTWTHACNSIPQQVVYQVLGSENVAQKGSADPQLEFPPSYRRTTSDVRVKTFSKLLQDEGVRGLYVLMDCTFPLAPVVRRWMSELEGFSNCCRMKELGVSAASLLAISTAPRMALAGSVSTSSAPKALSSTLSKDTDVEWDGCEQRHRRGMRWMWAKTQTWNEMDATHESLLPVCGS